MRQWWNTVLDLLYPPTCCACGAATQQPQFCARCRAAITTPASPLCPLCGIPFRTRGDTDHPCGQCLAHRPRFGRARACAVYDASEGAADPLKTVLQQYKYGRNVSLAVPLSGLFLECCPLPLETYDLIIPVPLHLSRLRWRGFNQAHFLAHRLALVARVPLDAFALQRVRPTRPQVQLNVEQRRQNVARAFRVVRPQRVCNHHVLLVDDVYTTGATVNECSRALLQADAKTVDVLVLARAILH